MGNANKKKHTAVMAAALAAAFAVPLIVLAVLYISNIQKNNFNPATAEVMIAENGGIPAETAENTFVFSLDDNGNYTAEKQVKIVSSGTADKSGLRVMIIPMWCDSDGNICGSIGNITDFRTQRLSSDDSALEYVNGYGETVLSLRLDDHWKEKWEFDPVIGTFSYKYHLEKGETTSALTAAVEITPAVYEASEGYELKLDVIADTIQLDGDAAEKRW